MNWVHHKKLQFIQKVIGTDKLEAITSQFQSHPRETVMQLTSILVLKEQCHHFGRQWAERECT